MCYCCCTTRKGILIYMMVVSIIAFIYGIVAISYFGSSTEIYKYFKDKLDNLDKSSSSSSSGSRYFIPQDIIAKLKNGQKLFWILFLRKK